MSSYEVSSESDSGDDTLRSALGASGVTTITFHPNVNNINITSELVISRSVSILGKPNLVINAGSQSPRSRRVFNINATNSHVIIKDMTITGAYSLDVIGSGINIGPGNTLELQNVNIIGNTASRGGGIYQGSNTILNIIYCNILNNGSSGPGGGIYQNNNSNLNISYSTIANNTTSTEAGGGIYVNTGSATYIRNCLINNNRAGHSSFVRNGGGISYNLGTNSTSIITNTTISNNNVINGNGGGININGFPNQRIILINCTICYNNANEGGGIRINNSNPTIELGNCLITNNTALSNPDIFGPIQTLGNNIINDPEGTIFIPNDDNDIVSPEYIGLSDVLQNNGGSTNTYEIFLESIAVDRGNNLLAQNPIYNVGNYDQRGQDFERISGGIVDIGAFEIQQAVICFSGDSMVLTKNINTNEIKEIKAKEVFSDYHQVFCVEGEKFIPIKLNVITRKINRFIKIERDLLGKDKPNADLYITSGHKVKYNGNIIKSKYLPNVKKVKVKPQEVYSICTEDECSILINNLEVRTWNYSNFIDYANKKHLSWKNNS